MSGGMESMAEDEARKLNAPRSGYYPFPVEAFRKYVEAMPQSEAQAALLYLAHFMAEREAYK